MDLPFTATSAAAWWLKYRCVWLSMCSLKENLPPYFRSYVSDKYAWFWIFSHKQVFPYSSCLWPSSPSLWVLLFLYCVLPHTTLYVQSLRPGSCTLCQPLVCVGQLHHQLSCCLVYVVHFIGGQAAKQRDRQAAVIFMGCQWQPIEPSVGVWHNDSDQYHDYFQFHVSTTHTLAKLE